ncbi:MAG: hypothetical protein QXE31_02920 [Candidatus Woesearchaeota archaeon]
MLKSPVRTIEDLLNILNKINRTNLIFFVGAFGPFHVGHFDNALLAANYFNALTVIAPIENIPHKPDVLPYQLRTNIIDVSIQNYPHLIRLEETDELNSENFMLVLNGYMIFSFI